LAGTPNPPRFDPRAPVSSAPRFPAFLRQLVDIVFPTRCSLCGGEIATVSWINICGECRYHLRPWKGAACTRCGVPFASELATRAQTDDEFTVSLCGRCRNGEYDFDLARSYGLYTGKLRTAILQLKFKRRERLGQMLGELLATAWNSLEEATAAAGERMLSGEAFLLVPVPLHSGRERQRGFNQAELLARGLAKGLRRALAAVAGAGPEMGEATLHGSGSRPLFRVEKRCLCRVRATIPQSGLSLSARRENVRGVFQSARQELIRGRTVVLIDDVMTTGATLSACARALKRAGARHVVALTLARATPQFPDTSVPA
jgi:predicted amidophosphoribosyltransferase